jgi:hypothetical protein
MLLKRVRLKMRSTTAWQIEMEFDEPCMLAFNTTT